MEEGLPNVRFSNWNYAGGQLLLGAVAVPALTIFAWWVILTQRPAAAPDGQYWAFVICLGLPLLVAGPVCLIGTLMSSILWLEVGPQVRYRTPLGWRSRKWGEVCAWAFEEDQGRVPTGIPCLDVPLGKHRVLSIKFGKWSEVRVKVPYGAEREIGELITQWQSTAPGTSSEGDAPLT
jgi:hypothetical protein